MRLELQSLSLLDSGTDVNLSPSILASCVDGQLDAAAFLQHKRDAIARELEETEAELLCGECQVDPPIPRKRTKRLILARRTENGEKEVIRPTESMWYCLYVAFPQIDCKRFHHKFRRRFRLPYQDFVDLVKQARDENWFPRWQCLKKTEVQT
jgi:hypothetical protein